MKHSRLATLLLTIGCSGTAWAHDDAASRVTIQVSGDSSVGGTTQWLTGEFSVAQGLTALQLMLYTFFVSIAALSSILRPVGMGSPNT